MFRPRPQLFQNLRRKLNRGIKLVLYPDLHQPFAVIVDDLIPEIVFMLAQVSVRLAQQALDRVNGIARVCGEVTLGIVPDYGFAVLREMHHRWHNRAQAHVVYRNWLPGFRMYIGYQAVGSPKIYTYDHLFLLKGSCRKVYRNFCHVLMLCRRRHNKAAAHSHKVTNNLGRRLALSGSL